MAEIHCRRRDGKLVYRLWSTVLDTYEHGDRDFTEAELREQLLFDATCQAVRGHLDVIVTDDNAHAVARAVRKLVVDLQAAPRLNPVSDATTRRIEHAQRYGSSSWTVLAAVTPLDAPWRT